MGPDFTAICFKFTNSTSMRNSLHKIHVATENLKKRFDLR